MSRKTIIRTPKDGSTPYVSISRVLAQDKTLTFEARGMMLYLLSQPSDWMVTVNDLQQKCGRDKVYKILKELKDHHYMTRERLQKPDGTFTWGDYRVIENPSIQLPLPEMPEMDTREPFPDSPYPVNTEINTHNRESTEQATTGAVAPVDADETHGPPKPTSERILVRDEVIDGCGFAKTGKEQKATYGRSGKLTRYLMGQPTKEGTTTYLVLKPEWIAKPGDFPRFVRWWHKKYPKIDVPRSVDKLHNRWSEWRENEINTQEIDSQSLCRETAASAAERAMYGESVA